MQPCLFYIVTYVLFSRLVSTFDSEVSQRCLPVHPSRITPIFVGTTLLFAVGEAVGVALTAVSGSTVQNIGNKVRTMTICVSLIPLTKTKLPQVALLSIGFQFFFVELFMLVLFIFRRRM